MKEQDSEVSQTGDTKDMDNQIQHRVLDNKNTSGENGKIQMKSPD